MKMRQQALLIMLFALGGCQNITTFLPKIDDINLESKKTEKLLVENLPAEISSITYSLEEIKNNWRKNVTRKYKLVSGKPAYEVYTGEKLELIGSDILKVEVVSLEKNEYELKLLKGIKNENTGISFRSIYSGTYILKITRKNFKIDTIKINNKLKYYMEKNEIYDIIKKLYFEKNYKGALKGNDFYKLSYPEEVRNNEELSYIELDLLIKMDYIREAKKVQTNLKKKKNLTEERVITLFKNERIINGAEYSPEELYYKYSEHYDEVKKMMIEHIASKNDKTVIENRFLENPVFKISASETGLLQGTDENYSLDGNNKNMTLGKKAYEKERYSESILYLEKILENQKKPEVFFLLGSSYWYLENHEKAIENYKKYIKYNEKDIRMAEAMYHTAVSQEKLGLEKLAEANYKKVKSNFPGTSWSRKSNISLVQLRK